MASLITCPICGTQVTPLQRFCPGCGQPRSSVVEVLKRDANRHNIPFERLLESARDEDAAMFVARERFDEFSSRVSTLENNVSRLTTRVFAIEKSPEFGAGFVSATSRRRPTTRRVIRGRNAPAFASTPIDRDEEKLATIEREAPALATEPQLPVPELSPVVTQVTSLPSQPEVAKESIPPLVARIEPIPELKQPDEQPWVEDSKSVYWPIQNVPTPTAGARRARIDYEDLVSGRGLAWVGGLAVLIGAVFFLSLAFSRGWIGPSARVIIGVATATLFVIAGGYFFERKEATFGHVLVSVGLGIMSLSMFAATRLYDLIPIQLGLVVTLATACLAALIAIRVNLQVVAAYGIVAALASPPVLGADPNGSTIAFLAATLVGTTVIALYKTWRWLAPLAFLLTMPQFAVWIWDDAPVAAGMVALAGFWLLNAISAGGEEFRNRQSRISPTSATLLMANVAFLVWAGFSLLQGDNDHFRGAFLFGVAAAHGLLGGYFLRKEGDRHPFGMLAFGTGLAALTMAFPVQFGGSTVTLAWISEAAALAWIYSKLKNPYGGAAALLLAGMAIGHLVTFEYPFYDLPTVNDPARTLMNGNGLTLAYVLMALAFAGYVLKNSGLRRWIVFTGAGLAIWAMPFEFSGVALVGVWVIISLLSVTSMKWAPLAVQESDLESIPEGLDRVSDAGHRFGLLVPAIVAYGLAAFHFVLVEYSPADIARVPDGVPFVHSEGLALAFLLAGAYLPAKLAGPCWRRFVLANLAGGLVIWAMPFELSGVGLVAGWSALAVLAARLGLWKPLESNVLHVEYDRNILFPFSHLLNRWGVMPVAVTAWILALGHLVAVEYPFHKIASIEGNGVPFLNLNGLALLILLGCSALIGSGRVNHRLWAVLAIFAVIYAMPFETSSLALIAGWTLITALAMAAGRWEPLSGQATMETDEFTGAPTYEENLARSGQSLLRGGLVIPALASWLLAVAHFFIVEVDSAAVADWTRPDRPFTDGPTLAALFVICAALLGSMLTSLPFIRIAWRVGAVLVAATLVPIQVGAASTVVLWSALSLLPLILSDRDRFGAPVYRGLSTILVGGGFLMAITAVAPPDRLFVDAETVIDHPFLWSGATAAFGACAAALTFTYWRLRNYPHSKWIAVASGALVVYLLSIGIVDHFQSRVSAGESLESLQKQAQVGLSILWALLGGGIFVAGVLRFGSPIRLFGLQLLGLATVKVFVWDLSTLDASYRVLSFIGLGVLLLGSSMLYQRFVNHQEAGEGKSEKPPKDNDHHHWHLPGGFHRGHSA